MLRDQIPDHIHHHGLMFAVAVDGVDFWSETPTCGRQSFRTISWTTKEMPRDEPRAAASENGLTWIGPADKGPLALEDRTIAVYRREPLGASLVTWQTRLRPREGMKSIQLGDSHYFGLGMRFVESMDAAVVPGIGRLAAGRAFPPRKRLSKRKMPSVMSTAPSPSAASPRWKGALASEGWAGSPAWISSSAGPRFPGRPGPTTPPAWLREWQVRSHPVRGMESWTRAGAACEYR